MDLLNQLVGNAGSDRATVGYTVPLLTVCLALAGYHYYTSMYTYFERRGVKGPRPLPLLGNLIELFSTKRMEIERQWAQQYGKLFGVFVGTRPQFFIADAEVLRQICIKDFDAMPNHEPLVTLNKYQKEFIFFLQDDKWKRVRALQSPTFTSGKIKRMFKLLDRCADDLVASFSEQLVAARKDSTKEIVNVRDLYSLYTMDAITTAAYTIKLNRQGQSNIKAAATRDDFVRLALRIFEVDYLRMFAAVALPKWLQLLTGVKLTAENKLGDIAVRLEPVLRQRRQSGKRFDDYLQILVDAQLDDRIELEEMDEKENHHAGVTQESLKSDQERLVRQVEAADKLGAANGKHVDDAHTQSTSNAVRAATAKVKLTDHEVLCSAVFLLIVGMETTATLLTNCTYALSFHLDIQQRLYETVKRFAKYNPDTGEYSFTYEDLTSSEYLDAVVCETLRCLAPVLMLDRFVNQDYLIEKYNLQLRKGDRLQLSYYSIMNNPEYWPDPLRFDPERFMGDNKKKIVPGSYCPFGLGPPLSRDALLVDRGETGAGQAGDEVPIRQGARHGVPTDVHQEAIQLLQPGAASCRGVSEDQLASK